MKYLILGMTLCLVFLLTTCSKGPSRTPPVTLNQVWATDPVLKTPESVLFDPVRNVLYVANINGFHKDSKDGDGFISRLTPDGKVEALYWVSGLNDPKGMALYNDVLYVADLTEVVAIAVKTGSVLGKYPAEGAKFLNDVTVNQTGAVFISDSDAKKIYQLQNGQVSVWIDNTQNERPNGLLMEDNQLLSALMSQGTVKKVNLQSKAYADWIDGIPATDGIVRYRDGYFVSSWAGEVYYIDAAGGKWKLIDTKEQKVNAADIGMAEQTNTLFVPTFNDNRVVAYRIALTGK